MLGFGIIFDQAIKATATAALTPNSTVTHPFYYYTAPKHMHCTSTARHAAGCCRVAVAAARLLFANAAAPHRHHLASAQSLPQELEASAYSSQLAQHVTQVPVPLCRRPGQHTEQLSALMQWRQGVFDEIHRVRDTFAAADGGPSTSELQVGQFGPALAERSRKGH